MKTLTLAIIFICVGMAFNYISATSTADAQFNRNRNILRSIIFVSSAIITAFFAFMLTFLGFDIIVSLTLKYFQTKMHILFHVVISLVATSLSLYPYFRYILRTSRIVLMSIERRKRRVYDL